jgi:hypothetical protein
MSRRASETIEVVLNCEVDVLFDAAPNGAGLISGSIRCYRHGAPDGAFPEGTHPTKNSEGPEGLGSRSWAARSPLWNQYHQRYYVS